MDDLVKALGPAFAAGFALQRLFELIDPLLASAIKTPGAKKTVFSVVSLLAGVGLAWWASLRILEPLGILDKPTVDIVVTGLFITGGTEGFNSVMKFLGYKKEEKKAESLKEQGVARSLDSALSAG